MSAFTFRIWQAVRLYLTLMSLAAASMAHAVFYSEAGNDWSYRAPITVDPSTAPGSTIILNVDFDDLIGQTTAPGTFDSNSVRVVKNETTLVGEQEFNDTVLSGQLDPTGNGEGEVRFILEDAPGTVDYHLYFDITGNGAKPANPAQVVNGTFEQATGAPTRWTVSSQRANGAQNNESYSTALGNTFAVPGGCSTGGATVDNAPNNDGTVATGSNWHLMGYRDQCEDATSGNELIRLSRDLRIPAGAAAGDLEFSFQVQAWDGISNATNYDWFVIYINNTAINHTSMGVVAGSPALVVENTRFGRSAFGAGLIDHGWRDARLDLSAFQNSTINLRFEARFSSADNSYRSWIKIDDVAWSTSVGSVGTPELDSISVASFRVSHDSNGIYCLAEPVTVRAVDATGTVIPDFAGTITLDTQQSSGQYSLSAGAGAFSTTTSGTASYSFVPADGGQATFSLSYPQGPSVLDIDAFLDTDSTIRDDDSEGNLTFSPSGFTFTASPLANPPPSPIDPSIPAQISATTFALYISAYGVTDDDPVCGVIENYAGAKPLAFWQTLTDPATGTLLATVDSTTVGSSSVTGVTVNTTFTSGQARVDVQYPDVGEMTISARDTSSGATSLAGSTNNFIVKPARLIISRIESAGGLPNPAAASLTGPGFVPAGIAFEVDVDAVNANNALTPNFGLESTSERPAVRSEALILPAGGINGSTGDVSNGAAFSASPTAGRFTNTTVAFDETGTISLRARLLDDDYMGAGDITRPVVSPVGRFYPARFELVSGSLSPGCNSFTYMDQPALGLSFEIQALNSGGAITTNYSDALYGSAATADLILRAENSNNGIDLASRLSALSTSWSAGRQSDITQLTFSRGALPDGPYGSVIVSLGVDDPLDATVIEGANQEAGATGDCSLSGSCETEQVGSASALYFGRTLLLPAQGPETSNLSMGIEQQFFNGSEFERNSADSCSQYRAADASLANFTDNLQAGETSALAPLTATTFLSGATQPSSPFSLAAPGAGNTGTTDVTLNVDAWLRFDWLGLGIDNPTATASFGGFRGHDRIIYWKEQR